MPAKENSILIQNEAKLIRKDVDNLVLNIKENLNLHQYDSSVLSAATSDCGGGNLTELPDFDYPCVSSTDHPTHNQNSFKARSSISRGSRASPYGVVASKKCDCLGDNAGGVKRSAWAARKRYPSMSANGKTKQVELDDTLEMLHELISEGNLLKEAVRRLHAGLSPKIQRNFYDSDADDDCRSPPSQAAVPTQQSGHAYADLCEIGIN